MRYFQCDIDNNFYCSFLDSSIKLNSFQCLFRFKTFDFSIINQFYDYKLLFFYNFHLFLKKVLPIFFPIHLPVVKNLSAFPRQSAVERKTRKQQKTEVLLSLIKKSVLIFYTKVKIVKRKNVKHRRMKKIIEKLKKIV